MSLLAQTRMPRGAADDRSPLMRRWELSAIGRENLTLATTPRPQPGAGEVLVKVAAVALNNRDKHVIDSGMGLPLPLPFVPASDMAGVIIACGDGAARFSEGDRVISTFAPDWRDGAPPGNARAPHATLGGVHQGVLADYLALPESWLAHAPFSLDDEEASTLPCAGLTAWSALVELGGLRAGQTVLIHGSGGVAIFALQIAKAHGARVIVVSGGEQKRARLIAMGANHVLLRSEDWVEQARRLTNDRGVDHVLETIGGDNLDLSLQTLAPNGRASLIGVQGGFASSVSAAQMLGKQITVQGIGVGHRRALDNFVRYIDRVGLKPAIDARYAFAELPAALAHLDRGPFGKLVINIA